MLTYAQPERSLLTSIYTAIDDGINTLANNFRNKTDDLIETMLDVSISELCNNTLKNYAYMQRHMRINAVEHDITRRQLGSNAVPYGDSSKTNVTLSNPSYAGEVNYYNNYVRNKEGDKTRIVIQGNDGSNTSYDHGEIYTKTRNLFPDDLNALNGKYTSVRWQNLNELGIMAKTKKLFEANKVNTIISRFSTTTGGVVGVTDENDVKSQYGMSHGRNLLRKEFENGDSSSGYNINGYNNPYCRVWTHHYQYDRLDKLIRPFTDITDGTTVGQPVKKTAFHTWGGFENTDSNGYGWKAGGDSAKGWNYSVLNDNGFVNITPKYDKDKKIHTKQCMFSIENLAWKGYSPYAFEKALSWEQRGPLGGRIMWFPPYGIQFNETTQANWSNHTFIGRGEDVYTYTNTVRSGNLSFMMVVDHPSIIDYVSWHGGGEAKDTDLLRFFAGCGYADIIENVKPTPLTDELTQISTSKYYTKPELKTEDPVIDEDIPEEVRNVTFYVFYPNNYSGYYDRIGNQVEAIPYLLKGSNAQKRVGDNHREDVPISFSDPDTFISSNGRGYEMGTNGVSDNESTETGPIIGSAIRWNKAMANGTSEYVENSSRQWWYRIDGLYEIPKTDGDTYKNTYDQILLRNNNYQDREGFNLNLSSESVKQLFPEDENSTVYSLAEMAAALCPDEEIRNNILSLGVNQDTVNEIRNLFDSSEITKINGIGFSNSHGNNSSKEVNDDRNDFLAKQRVETAINWLKTCKEKYKTIEGNIQIEPRDSDSSVQVSTQDVSNKESKKWRSAKITLEVRTSSSTKVSDANQTTTDENGNTTQHGTQKYIGYNTKTNANGTEYFVDNDGRAWVEVTNPDDKHFGELVMVDNEKIENGDATPMETIRQGNQADNLGDGISSETTTENISGGNNTYRYDQEYHFFKTLQQQDPIVFNELMKKIQYFDPAFHSMTPEGFSGRLNFLHQCTRQGNTIGASDTQGTTASNLAFGRPPICVLRLGDFYNQMIVIDNISINFDSTWDLNIEGAGVIPMIANITISFKFIGGGDLAGPIRRLQNAMSFNYYANGRLYDNRADRVVYNSDGTGLEQGALDSEINQEKSYYYTTEMYKNDINEKMI